MTAKTTFALLITAAFLACAATGCSSTKKKAAETSPSVQAVITDAYYTGSGDPNLRKQIIATGSHFKVNGKKSDCQTSLPDHPVESQRKWKDAKKVITATGIMYHVEAYHGAAYDNVHIRVKGADGQWSQPYSVREN